MQVQVHMLPLQQHSIWVLGLGLGLGLGAAATVFVIKRGKSPSKTSDTNTRRDTRRSGDTELV